MALSIASRFKNAWNVFKRPYDSWRPNGPAYSTRPDRNLFSYGNDNSIATVLYNRIAMDAAAIDIQHVRLDNEGRFLEVISSELNNCLTLDANIDQTGRAMIQDAVYSMLDEGIIAIVPIDTDEDPKKGSFDVLSLRVGKIVEWYPMDIRVEVYDERNGRSEEIVVSKETTAIVENPFYSVINRPNSTMKRLRRKLALLDLLDERIASGKLDIIIQLPYMIRGESKRHQAEMRRKDIEDQLIGSKYGIAYIDSSEHITQLNRPAENAFVTQVDNLTDMVYNQLGMSKEILDGSADENTMQNYQVRTVEPIIAAITDEMKRKFLTKTARTQGQSVKAFRDPFKLVPVSSVAEMADKFIRNQILTPNEFRQIIGRRPSEDPKADELRNPNIAQSAEELATEQPMDENGLGDMTDADFAQAFSDLDELDKQLDELDMDLNEGEIKHYASPYYDPVKAHEYYLKTRELKGRSTSSLNDNGKKAATYVKKLLTEERKQKVEEHKTKTNEEIAKSKEAMNTSIANRKEQVSEDLAQEKEVTKQSIAEYKDQTEVKIDRLKSQLAGMSKASKEANSERINEEIAKLKADNTAQREKLNAAYKEYSATARSQRTAENAADRAKHKETSTNLRTAHKEKTASLKAEYDQKYYDELDKMLADTSFKKTTKKKK